MQESAHALRSLTFCFCRESWVFQSVSLSTNGLRSVLFPLWFGTHNSSTGRTYSANLEQRVSLVWNIVFIINYSIYVHHISIFRLFSVLSEIHLHSAGSTVLSTSRLALAVTATDAPVSITSQISRKQSSFKTSIRYWTIKSRTMLLFTLPRLIRA